jgi:SET domain-containing protein
MPSKTAGVGVFAIQDIPININPFNTTKPINYKIIKLQEKDIKLLDDNVQKMLSDFCKNDDTYDVPYLGLNSIDISFYLNHSENPNLDLKIDDNCEYFTFQTNKFIKKGSELFINYKN